MGEPAHGEWAHGCRVWRAAVEGERRNRRHVFYPPAWWLQRFLAVSRWIGHRRAVTTVMRGKLVVTSRHAGQRVARRADAAAVPEPGTAATAIASLAVVAACCRRCKRSVRSARCHLSNQPLPRRAVGILTAKMAKWSLWPVGWGPWEPHVSNGTSIGIRASASPRRIGPRIRRSLAIC